MVYRMLREDGWFFGSSTGINLCAAVKIAREMGPGHTIVTILCDAGHKYQSTLFNPAFLEARNLATRLTPAPVLTHRTGIRPEPVRSAAGEHRRAFFHKGAGGITVVFGES